MSISDLIEFYPFAVHYLAQKGIRCVICGEPIWLSLEEAARERGFTENEIDEVVNDLRIMAISEDKYNVKTTGKKKFFIEELSHNQPKKRVPPRENDSSSKERDD